jgi:protein TonB
MNFAQQRQTSGNTAGLAIVVALHVVLGYALVNGLGRKLVDVLKKPLEVAIIQEIKIPPPPPPPPKELPRVAKVVAPPPPYVPPPEVRVESPPVQNVITTTSSPDPNPPTPSVPVAEATPAPVAPQAVSVALACPNHMEVRSRLPYPSQAQRMGLSGDVLLEFTVTTTGQISDVTVVKSSNRLFNSTAANAVNQLRCNGLGHDVRVRVPFAFRMEA